jgi:hypothetical protein
LQEKFMAAKVTAKTTPPPASVVRATLPPDPTTLDHLAQIQELGRKIDEHVRLLAKADAWPGISAEVRGKAIEVFHVRLASAEKVLEKILDELRLE